MSLRARGCQTAPRADNDDKIVSLRIQRFFGGNWQQLFRRILEILHIVTGTRQRRSYTETFQLAAVWLSVRQSPAVWRYWWIPVIDILRWTEWDVEWTSCQTHTWTHGARGLIIIPVWPGTVTVGPLSTLPTCGASSISPDIRPQETCPFPRKLP